MHGFGKQKITRNSPSMENQVNNREEAGNEFHDHKETIMNEKETEDLFRYLEDISARLQRMNRHMVLYTAVLVIILAMQLLFG